MVQNWSFATFFGVTIFWSGAKQRFCFSGCRSIWNQTARIWAPGFLSWWQLTSHALNYNLPYSHTYYGCPMKPFLCSHMLEMHIQLVYVVFFIRELQLRIRSYDLRFEPRSTTQLLSLQMLFLNCMNTIGSKYRTRATITPSWFETTLDYKPRLLGPTFLIYVVK